MVSLSNDPVWHLFNLANDQTETKDLSAANPERVKAMEILWNEWAKANQVFPKPGKPN
jgi:arylsulfatase